jgi:hypothetical protein
MSAETTRLSTHYCMNCSEGYVSEEGDRCPECRSEGIPWDGRKAYEQTKQRVVAHQAKENPNTVLLADERNVRKSLCDTGSMPIDRYRQAVENLHEDGQVAYGARWIAYPPDEQAARDAIAWVVDRDEVDKEFVGSMNALLSREVFADE